MPENGFTLIVTNDEPPGDWSGTTGVSRLPRYASLEKHPMALSERGAASSHDHVHLAVYDDASGKPTDLICWWGRASDGRHYPLSRRMKIVPSECSARENADV